MMSNLLTSFGTQDSSDEEDDLKPAASTSSKTGPFQLVRRVNQPREDIPLTLQRWIPNGLTMITNEMQHLAKFCDDTIVIMNELLIKSNVSPLKDITLTVEAVNEPITTVTALDDYLVLKASQIKMCLFLFSLSPLFMIEEHLDTRVIHHYLLKYNRR